MSAAVLFDLDDTLYLERDYVESGFRAVSRLVERLGKTNARDCQLGLAELFNSGERLRVFDRWAQSRGYGEIVPLMIECYRDHTPQISLSAETRDCLMTVRSKCRTAVVSDGRLSTQQRKVGALGVHAFVDTIVLSDAWGSGYWKPHVKPYHMALARLGVYHHARGIYVGDNPLKDFLGARRAGLRSVRLRLDRGLHCELEPETVDHAPDLEVRSIAELMSALAGMVS